MPKKTRRLLEKMRRSAANWRYEELLRIYNAFGFEVRHGAKHDIIVHPEFPERLRTSLPRHANVKKPYVEKAVELIDQLLDLLGEEQDDQTEDEDESDE